MVQIVRSPDNGVRVVSEHVLSVADFKTVARQCGGAQVARKIGMVAARVAATEEAVVTNWEGAETRNVAKPGDFVVMNLDADGHELRDSQGHANIYVVKAAKFPELYRAATGHHAFGPLYKAIGTVACVALSGGFDIVAPWGERQQASHGYLLLNGEEVYGNQAQTFDATYEIVEAGWWRRHAPEWLRNLL